MKLRENLLVKILAFVLAAACFAASAVLGWFQGVNARAIWGDGAISGYTIRYLEQRDCDHIAALLRYYEAEEEGSTLGQAAAKNKEDLESKLSSNHTNLRWQVVSGDGQVLYGNDYNSFADVNQPIYEADFQWSGKSELNATTQAGVWLDYALNCDNLTQQEAENAQAYADWRNELSAAYEMYLGGYWMPSTELEDETDVGESLTTDSALTEEPDDGEQAILSQHDLDTVYTSYDGVTDLLIITEGDKTYVYGPSVSSMLEPNEFGAIYDEDAGWVWDDLMSHEDTEEWLSIYLWVNENLPVMDDYLDAVHTLQAWRVDRVGYLTMTIAFAVVGLLLAVYLCWAVGHKKGVDGIYLNWFHRIPGDLLVLVLAVAALGLVGGFLEACVDRTGDIPQAAVLTWVGLFAGWEAVLCGGALLTIVARCKGHTLWKNTVICRGGGWLLRLGKAALAAVPLVWKVAVLAVGYIFFTILLFHRHDLIWLLGTLVAAVWCCLWAYQWKRVRQGTHEIVSGQTDYQIDTTHMLPDLKAHADELNNLGQAISVAVDERMKSEHFKGELITNVSHDLKTPLTSIINYVDLLKKEDIDNPKAAEYIEVLDRKSQRLKKLTEDLVEASKASTGNLSVSLERVELRQLADQALAEYSERLEDQGLTVVRTVPDSQVWVQADGRHLWRVLDNLLSNCAKYALSGTRVYVEVRVHPDSAALSVKNISREALNVPPEALLERFVRGDESRTTEGSGLGLSIAQSLTELQNGRFDVDIDGDLFKATVTLPLAKTQE